MSDLFPGFTAHRVQTSGTHIQCEVGGSGPPLLLLHGYPQTHAMWHRIAPALAHTYTVVCADLRGYGDSGKPESDATHAAYAKRAMAQDMVDVMRHFGFPRFRLAGHDRGGRVAHRLCVDHPQCVERVAVLDISPTRIMFRQTDQAFATAYYHWFFLIQPFDLPEKTDRRRPAVLPAQEDGGVGIGREHLRPARVRGVRAVLRRSRDDPRDVRGLSRRRVDRPRARRCRRRRRPQGSRARCSCCGERRASCTGTSRPSRIGVPWRTTCVGGHCPPATTWPRKSRRKRCANSPHSSRRSNDDHSIGRQHGTHCASFA